MMRALAILFLPFLLIATVTPASATQLSQVHVVVRLEGTLIDGIPYSNTGLFPSEEIFNDPVTNKWFHIHPYAFEFLEVLKAGNNFSVLSNLPATTNPLALQKLGIEVKVYDAITKLKEEKSKTPIILISSWNEAEGLSATDTLINLVAPVYQYPTYAKLQENFEKAKQHPKFEEISKNYPSDEAAWLRDKRKLAEAVTQLHKKLEDVGTLTGLQWNLELKTAQCEQIDYASGEPLKIVSNTECVKKGWYKPAWSFTDASKTKIASCQLSTPNDLPIGTYKSQYCEKLGVDPLWTGPSKTACAIYTRAERAFVRVTDSKECGTLHWIYQASMPAPLVLNEFEGMDQLSIAEIAKRDRPDENHLNKYWNGERPLDLTLFDFKKCKDGFIHTIKAGTGGAPKFPECVPDTVYSWGPRAKLDDLKKIMGKGIWKDEFRSLYTTRSPIGSHGYGPIPIRIKISAKAIWYSSDYVNCASIKKEQRLTTVFYRAISNFDFFDITLCSPQVIESWSYGMEEHYDEIIREYQHLTGPLCDGQNCDIYYRSGGKDIFGNNIDGHDFSESTFWKSMRGIFNMIISGDQGLYCNPKLGPEVCNLQTHFKTKTPIYYNPD